MGIAEDLSAYVVETPFSAIPAETVTRAKWRIIDNLGCLIAGRDAAGCRGLLNLVKRWGGAEEGSVLTHGFKVPALNAAMMNSLMTRSFDFEPVEAEGETKSSPAHISGTTVPAAVTMGEWKAASGKDVLAALILGDDISARLGVASGFDFDLGWDNTGTLNGFGAAAIAGRLMKLNPKQIQNAYGIAVNQIAGSLDGVWDKAMTFKLCMSLAARTGIFSAELSQQGFTGLKDAFLGQFGYFKLYCKSFDAANLTKDLGKKFYADRVIKPYSACRATHSSIDTALKIADTAGFNPEAVKEIHVHLSPWVADGFTGEQFVPGEAPQISGAFSIRFTVATALLRKGVKPAYFTEDCIKDPKLHALIGKMKLISRTEGAPMSTQIEVIMEDGRSLKAATDFPRGDIFLTPLSDEEVRNKFRDNVAYSKTVSAETGEKALKMLENLENIADMREVTRLLG